MNVETSKGKHLTKMAGMLGLKRRWFGLEPDWLLRRRLFKAWLGEA